MPRGLLPASRSGAEPSRRSPPLFLATDFFRNQPQGSLANNRTASSPATRSGQEVSALTFQ